jgi:hypothetical protein
MQMYHPNVHVSEWSWIGQKIDYTIENDGTLIDLKRMVFNVLTEIENHDTINMLHNEGVVNEV